MHRYVQAADMNQPAEDNEDEEFFVELGDLDEDNYENADNNN